MRVQRSNILDALEQFVVGGSGVVVGSPGIGKTYLMLELSSRLEKKAIPNFLLPINQLGDGTEEALRANLGIDRDFMQVLREDVVHSGVRPGIILFDGFDAARNDVVQHRFLDLIRRVFAEFEGVYNIIVTVRTYDARRSLELLSLFEENQAEPDKRYRDPSIECRHFAIPSLNNEELVQAFDQMPGFQAFYESSPAELKVILRVPFNIWLLERIIRDFEFSELSGVVSQVQLLQKFWRARLTTTRNWHDREILLTRVTREMVNSYALSIRKEAFYDPIYREALEGLLSDEVISEVGVDSQRISYAHNILFDFAVAVLLVEETPEDLVKFLQADRSRPVFLRPSLTYYFTRLWYVNRDAFWISFWHVLPLESLQIRIVGRVIPPSTIVTEVKYLEELDQLFSMLKSNRGLGSQAVLRLLQALRTLGVPRVPLWTSFLETLSRDVDRLFAWDLGLIAWNILERIETEESHEKTLVRIRCGAIGQGLLSWTWQQRAQNRKDSWLDALGSTWGVRLVARTFDTSPQVSRLALEPIFELISEPRFPIDFIYRLADNLDRIWPYDPELALKCYAKVFAHSETSQEPTSFGTPVVPMQSTRRQDYTMVRHVLIDHFPKFLEDNPLAATKAAIPSLQSLILEDHVLRYLKEGLSLESVRQSFPFRGGQASYIPDGSHIWDHGFRGDEIQKLAHTLFAYLKSTAQERVSKLEDALDVFRDFAQVAFLWKRLLEVGTSSPTAFAPYLFELCIARPVQTNQDTFFALGTFLSSAFQYFKTPQGLEFERSVMALPKGKKKPERARFERYRNRFISLLPASGLKTPEANRLRQALEATGGIVADAPPPRIIVSSEPFTEDQWLKEQGADLERRENRELVELFQPLNAFTQAWMNKKPPASAIYEILLQARTLYARVNSVTNVDPSVLTSAWTKLGECSETISRGADDPESEAFLFAKRVLLICSRYPSPEARPDPEREYKFPSWSPAPRNEAAEGLPWLAARRADADIIQAIGQLVRDEEPSVRFLLVRNLFRILKSAPDAYWSFVRDVATNEQNPVVLQALVETLKFAVSQHEPAVVDVLKELATRNSFEDETGLLESFVGLLAWLNIERDNSWAAGVFNEFVSNPVDRAHSLRQLVFRILDYVNASALKAPRSSDYLDKSVSLLSRAVSSAWEAIRSRLRSQTSELPEEEAQRIRHLFGVIDEVVTRLHFAIEEGLAGGKEGKEEITLDEVERFYWKVMPILRSLLGVDDAAKGEFVVLAPTAHHFMELLNNVLPFDPQGVIHLAAALAIASKRTGYNFDSLAIGEVVKLVETVLASYRYEVRDDRPLEDLLTLLDVFAEAGWPEALRLVWRLDEIFR